MAIRARIFVIFIVSVAILVTVSVLTSSASAQSPYGDPAANPYSQSTPAAQNAVPPASAPPTAQPGAPAAFPPEAYAQDPNAFPSQGGTPPALPSGMESPPGLDGSAAPLGQSFDNNVVPLTMPDYQAPPLAPGPGTSMQTAPVDSGVQSLPGGSQKPGAPAAPGTAGSQVVSPVPVGKEEKSHKRTLALVRTSLGNFTIRLFTRQAPRTTQNFVDLARGDKEFIDAKTGRKTRRPFYNGLIFHRVIKNFIVQGGCPFGNGKGGPGYTIADEFTPNLRHRKPGIVSMANANVPDSNGSQFFITLGPQPDFDDKYTVFGEVIQGMDVVTDLSRTAVGPTNRPVKRVYIIAIDIIEE